MEVQAEADKQNKYDEIYGKTHLPKNWSFFVVVYVTFYVLGYKYTYLEAS